MLYSNFIFIFRRNNFMWCIYVFLIFITLAEGIPFFSFLNVYQTLHMCLKFCCVRACVRMCEFHVCWRKNSTPNAHLRTFFTLISYDLFCTPFAISWHNDTNIRCVIYWIAWYNVNAERLKLKSKMPQHFRASNLHYSLKWLNCVTKTNTVIQR